MTSTQHPIYILAEVCTAQLYIERTCNARSTPLEHMSLAEYLCVLSKINISARTQLYKSLVTNFMHDYKHT